LFSNEIFDFSKTRDQLLARLWNSSMGQSEALISAFFPLRDAVPSYDEPLRAVPFGNTSLTRILFASGAWDANTPQYYADSLFPGVTINNSSDPNAKFHFIAPKATHITTLRLPCGSAVSAAFVKRDDAALAAALASADCQSQAVDYQYARNTAGAVGMYSFTPPHAVSYF
jgi:hypothetical protein